MADVLAYHPEYDDYEKWPGSCAVVRGFQGEIVLEERGEEIAVVGRGNINFHTESE